MGRTRIKICGIKTPEAAAAAVDAGADAVGFVFVTSSPRYIHPEDAYELMAALPPFVASVGVFMNPTLDEFSDAEELCPTLLTQLHGSEEPKLVRQVGPDVIKALAFDPDTLPDHLLRYADLDEVSALLIDATTPGQGVPFAWDKLPPLLDNVTKPVILAGGLTPDNVEAAIRAIRPYGVDVSSGVERERGTKDPGLIEAFCEAVRRADATS